MCPVPYAISEELQGSGRAHSTFATCGLDQQALWKRKHVRAAFAPSAVRLCAPGVCAHTDWLADALAALPSGTSVDVQERLMALVLDAFGATSLAGYRFDALTDAAGPGSRLVSLLPLVFEEALYKRPRFWRRLLPVRLFPSRVEALAAAAATDAVFEDVLHYGRALPPEEVAGTLLGSLLSLRDAGASEEEGAPFFVTFIFRSSRFLASVLSHTPSLSPPLLRSVG